MALYLAKRTLILFVGILISSQAIAGWISGGGKLIKDGRNPWFIQNTFEVRYCVIIDSSHFNQTEAIVNRRIVEAIEYWKDEFSRAAIPNVNGMQVKVATQNFVLETCQATTDLVFQMGYLSQDQIDFIGDPSQFIGLAVRTEYDKVNLRGKGFIYIAADSGPLKPSDSQIIDSPWKHSSGGLLWRMDFRSATLFQYEPQAG